MMKKLILLLFLVTTMFSLSFAQETENYKPRTGFGFVPQYTVSGGLRFDVDFSLSKASNQWLVLSPQVYWVTGSRYGHDFEELTGAGMDVKHKIYLKPASMKPAGFYVQYGVIFQYFSITDYREYGAYYIEDGVEYYGVFEGEINTKLYKFGGNFDMGYQWLIGNKIYFDLYLGAGIRISKNNRNDGFDTWYNDHWYDYGYSGTLIDAGFRLGLYH